ncbi:hypothetical protein NC651_004242 [Populus alba x Populus x berolinensis]|nr:hypothetical protein NC651_004242 [Populus alba x Populus x berolinensis]
MNSRKKAAHFLELSLSIFVSFHFLGNHTENSWIC